MTKTYKITFSFFLLMIMLPLSLLAQFKIMNSSNEEIMRVTSGKRVGIGTAAPDVKLSVVDNTADWASKFNNQNSGSMVMLAHGDGYGLDIETGTSASSMTYAMRVHQSTTPYLEIRGDGYAGIGTSTMKGWVNVEQTGTDNFNIRAWNNSQISVQTLLDVRNNLPQTLADRAWSIRSYTTRQASGGIASSRVAVMGHLYSDFSNLDGNPDGTGLLTQGALAASTMDNDGSGDYSTICGLYGIVDGNAVSGITDVSAAVRGHALDNSTFPDNVFAAYFTGAVSYFERAVGIGTVDPQYRLDVVGDIRATGSVYYGGNAGSANGTAYTKPDYVFEEAYEPMSFDEVETFIQKENHLPWITAAKEERSAVNMTRMGFQTLEAVENLQLQNLSLYRQIEELKKEIAQLKNSK
jgi:hypothetical protein